MAVLYHKTFRVPVWVAIGKCSSKKAKALIDALAEAESRIVEWPTTGYAETYKSFASKGWAHEVNQEMPYFLNPQLLAITLAAHLKKFNDQSSLTGMHSMPFHRISRKIEKEEDLDRIANDLLSLETPIVMSKLFQIGELCHNEGSRNYRVFVTSGYFQRNMLTELSDKVIVVSEDNGDINPKDLKIEELIEKTFESIKNSLGL